MSDNTPPDVPVQDYRPVERFWPYVNLPEQPTPEELAELHPELAEALFGRPKLPFSVSLEFADFGDSAFVRALELARTSDEYRELRTPDGLRYRARFYPEKVLALRDLFDLVGPYDSTDVLIDDKPVPYARELWLPLMWLLLIR